MNCRNLLAGMVGVALAALLLVACSTSEPPSARGLHAMAYDSGSDRVILHGGIDHANKAINGTWAFDPSKNTWSDMAPDQLPSFGHGPMAYDTQSDRMILFLGILEPGGSGEYLPGGETWAYDFTANAWTNMEPTGAPPSRQLSGANMGYDAESDRMIMFGGVDYYTHEFPRETWAYDYDSNSWTRMAPEVSPPGRYNHAMAYDDRSDRAILFGGCDTLYDTWAYDHNADSWEELEPAEVPRGRCFSDMVYYPGSGRLILFGGGAGGIQLNDTWAYQFDTNTWTELEPDEPPSQRAMHALAYNSKAGKAVLFGGAPSGSPLTDETWIYDPAANTWKNVSPRR